jgi:hypothetical protein
VTTDLTDKLVVRFADDGDGTGKLWVSGSADGFAGTGAAWFDTTTLQEFAQALTRFPLSDTDLPTLSGGFWSTEGKGIEQEHVFLQVYQADPVGHLHFHVRLATEVWAPDRIESQHRVQLEIRTGYQALLEFSRMLQAVILGNADEAVLIGDE